MSLYRRKSVHMRIRNVANNFYRYIFVDRPCRSPSESVESTDVKK